MPTDLPSPEPSLADLRVEIDKLDEQMHRLLMARGDIIDRLIDIKRKQGGGSAFRPDREASMMRQLVARHRGILPLDTVEGIWRVIISTFTYVQAPYAVHVDLSGGDADMRDSARFHFGFTTPYAPQPSARAVIEAVARSKGDLGLIRIDGGAAAGAWWMDLTPPNAPKIIARLPFLERPTHPAGTPVFVVSHPLPEAAAREVALHAILVERWRSDAEPALAALGARILENASHEFGLSAIVESSSGASAEALAAALAQAGLGDVRVFDIGAHARRFEFVGASADPFPNGAANSRKVATKKTRA